MPVRADPPDTDVVPDVRVASVPQTKLGVVETAPAAMLPFSTAELDVTDVAAEDVADTGGDVHVTVAIPSPSGPNVALVAVAVTESVPATDPV